MTTTDAVTPEARRFCTERGLTPRQWQVCEELVTGGTNQEIADRLYIELRTVKGHVTAINRALGTTGKHQIVCLLVGTMATPDSAAE